MVGNVILDKEQIKKVLKEYYIDRYDDCTVLIKDVRDEKELTGIVISHKHKVNSNTYVTLEEELSIEDLKEIFSDIFNNAGYVAEYVYLDTYEKANGIFTSLILKNIGITLHKQKVKCKSK